MVVVFFEPKTPLRPAKMFRFRLADAEAFEPISDSCVEFVVVDWDWDWDWRCSAAASRWAMRRVIFYGCEITCEVSDF